MRWVAGNRFEAVVPLEQGVTPAQVRAMCEESVSSFRSASRSLSLVSTIGSLVLYLTPQGAIAKGTMDALTLLTIGLSAGGIVADVSMDGTNCEVEENIIQENWSPNG